MSVIPGAAANHLRESPERDPVAVRRAATLVPHERLGEAVDVFLQLPHQTRLADARHTYDVQQARAALATGSVQQLLGEPQLLVTSPEWRLRCAPAAGQCRRGAARRRRRRDRLAYRYCFAIFRAVCGRLQLGHSADRPISVGHPWKT